MGVSKRVFFQYYKPVLLLLFVTLVFLDATLNEIEHGITQNSWTIGDWLINYSGGFVRRGLFGEIATNLALITHTNPIYFVVGIQIISYFIIFYGIFFILKHLDFPWWSLYFLASPAILLFQVLDRKGGYRKEILFFAWLILLVIYKLRWSQSFYDFRLLAFSTLFALVIVLSHEAMFLYFPYYIALAYLISEGKSYSYRVSLITVPTLFGFIAFILSIFNKGNYQVVNEICQNLMTLGMQNSICSGAISSLGLTSQDGFRLVVNYLKGYFFIYSLSIFLAMIPIFYYFLVTIPSPIKRR